jgi:tripartite-type tricarboxylate transporter receptor subunit TctC
MRARLSRALLAVVLCATPLAALAQSAKYPDRPVHLVIPYPPGGSTDIIARLVAQKLSASLGQPVVVENKGGAATAIGAAYAARQKPDGYTLLFAATPVSTNALLYKNLQYQASDFVPVASIGKTVNVLSIHSSLPAKDFAEFLTYARANPGKLIFASSGRGGLLHLITEKFMATTGISMVHVPYQGAGPTWTDYLAGRIQVYFDSALATVPYAEGGKIRILAVGDDNRLPSLPDVPTMKELGFPMTAYAWYGIYAPAGTPRDIVELLNKEVNKAVASPEVGDRLKANGGVPIIGTPEQFAEFVKADYQYWESVVRPLNIQLD